MEANRTTDNYAEITLPAGTYNLALGPVGADGDDSGDST